MWYVCIPLSIRSFADAIRGVSEDLLNILGHHRISVLKIIMLVIFVFWIPAAAMAGSRLEVKVFNIRRAF